MSLQRTAGGAFCLHLLLSGPPPLSFIVSVERMKVPRQFIASPVVAIAAIMASLVCWHLVGELRWGQQHRPWSLQMPPSQHAQVFGTCHYFKDRRLSGAFRGDLDRFGVWRRRTAWRIAYYHGGALVLIAFVP